MSRLSVNLAAMADGDDEDDKTSILDLRDHAVCADAIFPKLPKSCPFQGIANASRVVELTARTACEVYAIGQARP